MCRYKYESLNDILKICNVVILIEYWDIIKYINQYKYIAINEPYIYTTNELRKLDIII